MTASLKILKIDRNPNRLYRVGTVSSLDDVPDSLLGCSPHFVLLLAVDASTVEDQRISVVAKTLLDKGLAGFSVWGPDCSRVHDLFDLERSGKLDALLTQTAPAS